MDQLFFRALKVDLACNIVIFFIIGYDITLCIKPPSSRYVQQCSVEIAAISLLWYQTVFIKHTHFYTVTLWSQWKKRDIFWKGYMMQQHSPYIFWVVNGFGWGPHLNISWWQIDVKKGELSGIIIIISINLTTFSSALPSSSSPSSSSSSSLSSY